MTISVESRFLAKIVISENIVKDSKFLSTFFQRYKIFYIILIYFIFWNILI